MAPELDNPAASTGSFWDTAQRHGYTSPAIRVDSAEAWHQHFRWTKETDAYAQQLLSPTDAGSAGPGAARPRRISLHR
jgi:hypothetical protein